MIIAFDRRRRLVNVRRLAMKTRLTTLKTERTGEVLNGEVRSHSAPLPKFIRLEPMAMELGISTSTIYSHIAQSLFPPPIKLGTASIWLRSEIELYEDALIRAVPRSEMRALVKSWVAARYKDIDPNVKASN